MLLSNQHFLLSAKMNGTQRRIVHEECIVRTAICQKAPLRPKQHRTVKKIKPIALDISYACLKESVSQLLGQSVNHRKLS